MRLLEDVFDGWSNHVVESSLLEHWRWKHLDNPLGRSLVLVTESGVESAYADSGIVDSRERLELFMTPVGGSRVSEVIKGFKPERMYYCWGDHDSLPTSVARS